MIEKTVKNMWKYEEGCPYCSVKRGYPCLDWSGRVRNFHIDRLRRALNGRKAGGE